jgi:NAD(P)H-dependent FMN reductase
MTPLKLSLIFGSVRSERRGVRALRYLERAFAGRGHAVTTIDPAEYRLPFLDRMYKEYPKGTAPEPLERLAEIYRAADAFVIVTGEYNHSMPPALMNLLDHFLEEYFWRPSAIVCYSAGMFGGVRAAVQLRAPLCELGMPSIPSLLPIPRVQAALDEAGTPSDPEGMARRFNRFASELEWYAEALREQRMRGVPY